MNSKKNYWLVFMDSVFCTNSSVFMSINTIIPFFLNKLGAKTFEISIASALVSIGSFISQPVFSRMASALKYKLKTFIKILAVQRSIMLIMAMMIPMFSVKYPQFMIVLFLVCWGLYSFLSGANNSFFMSIFSKTIPVSKRGRLLGYSGSTANLLAIYSSYLMGKMLKQIVYPYNFMVMFGIGSILLLIDTVDIALMEEPADNVVEQNKHGYFSYFKEIPEYMMKNKVFTKMVIGFCLIVISTISLSYYSLFAIRTFHISSAQIAVFSIVTVITGTVGNVFFGTIADRLGHRTVLQISGLCGAAASVFVLFFHSVTAVFIAFALSTLCNGAYFISGSNFIIQNTEQENIPVYVSINSMITLVISSVITLTSGLIIDKFSFTPIFYITGISGLLAFLTFFTIRKSNNVNAEDKINNI